MAEPHSSKPVISLFRFRTRDLTPVEREEYSSTLRHMLTLASAMPGFISFRRYMSDDGEAFAVTEFASAEALAAWRDHPDHRTAQQRGRNEFYSEYEIINCTVMHRYGHKH
jgi:heme-degrading monooxygenase HmoA